MLNKITFFFLLKRTTVWWTIIFVRSINRYFTPKSPFNRFFLSLCHMKQSQAVLKVLGVGCTQARGEVLPFEQDSEAIWIQVQLCKTSFLVGCVYRAPNESLEVFDYLDDLLRYATQKNLEVIILGDLNCDYLNDSLGQTKRLLEFLAANELEQIIKEPTRVTCNTRSLIDLLVTSTPSLFRKSVQIFRSS